MIGSITKLVWDCISKGVGAGRMRQIGQDGCGQHVVDIDVEPWTAPFGTPGSLAYPKADPFVMELNAPVTIVGRGWPRYL